jgi:hypothetical protein
MSAGYTVKDCAVEIGASVIHAAAEAWALREADCFGRIRMRGVADHVVLEDVPK